MELPLGAQLLSERRVMLMITYAELFQFGLLIVAVITLCLKKRDQ